MRVLLTNDDGVYAEGIQSLREHLERLPNIEVNVVAPDRERSASGHAITLHKPLHITEVDFPSAKGQIWSVNGTPADCTKIGVKAVLPEPPDLVISGINRGSNLGTDVLYSGTVSAAMEGVLLGIPSLAVSLTAFDDVDFGPAADFIAVLVQRIAKEGLPKATLLNINIPPLERNKFSGVAITRLGERKYSNLFEERIDPRGRKYYWMAGEVMEDNNSEDTDIAAIKNNMISITPLQLNLTDEVMLSEISHWQEGLQKDFLPEIDD